MHIVERVAGDFTPNNMIYHELQSFHLLPADSVEGRPPQDTDASLSSMAVFSQLVTAMQQQAPQSPQDIAAELLDAEDTARAAATAAQKRALDPLSTNADAAAKSTANVEQLRAYAAAAMGAFQSVPVPAATATASAPPSPLAPYTFTFFPHPVPVAVSVPYCSAHFCVMVNLKPIVPNHLMVVPIRCVGTVHGLTEAEVEDWGHVMRCTIDVLEELRLEQQQHSSAHGEASVSAPLLGNYSVAVQQGALAGQTVAHLHVHVIPFDPQGKLAGEPETDELEQQRRPPRTPATMKAETDALRPLFIKYAAAAAAAAASRKK
ncbi:hypothetical protein ABB37_02084 [Leptomonas pyrrhocoris]|uniref:HIT domain-containing protein n=1 Tax=Leptomonas pyrrhocoris TaxID=157538 RepID=A0A0M9G763_LEPPY|nr:hypothetical protein ABB37_02084 [Leptomonas pyrrhocoris]XP_015662347.1 hypothetical protein ABB37_02084 [Leptomonas pyrrhocoris]XP_015662348.1 hypothetical protein ABB37_02084 [Leptomonas pyrrhocoris]KPA83907.1 hypothetical protein ABB37_02084 [Leptomonas pyrrhocoris]KPA83908.1 hypothetical protein ABB37_02084 [Leptomonas pyrrhocoris]KPA83909.1 hypothetical protein ABB37_02084 [Leptomonas pyrrhocoris]|eukprot:XP_015662346.1 hypothetical protein ABB37_02084 [Leptomonas pyrrhocoris]